LESDCNQTHSLISFRKGLPSETESRKRQRLIEIKDFEDGKKCLSPSIFRKSKGPIIFSASHQALTSNATFETSIKGVQIGSKRGDGAGLVKEISLNDFDIN
jgi:hypothetical protein